MQDKSNNIFYINGIEYVLPFPVPEERYELQKCFATKHVF